MINVLKKVQITSGQAPYTYVWSVDSTCVSFSSITGSTTGLVETTVSFTNQSCIDTSVITLAVTDATGCQTTLTVPITGPCQNFNIGAINSIGGSTFVINPSGGSGQYTYQWQYEPAYWINAIITGNSIVLTPNSTLPDSVTTPISVIVTDSNGCSNQASVAYTLCRPVANNMNVTLDCSGRTNTGFPINTKRVNMSATECNTFIDWKTLEFTNVPTGLTITHPFKTNSAAIENEVSFLTQTLNVGNYTMLWRVKDINGVWSDFGILNVIIVECNIKSTDKCELTAADCKCILVPCNATFVEFDLDDFIITPDSCDCKGINDIDWSTFQILSGPYQSGASVTFNQATHVLTYTLGTGNGSDLIQFTVGDTSGNFTGTLSLTIILECEAAPIAFDDTACANCGDPLSINILANDTLNGGVALDPLSVMITQGPTNGSFTLLNGVITYTANVNFSGTDTIKYKVSNYDGQASNVATVTITVTCAGGDGNVVLC